MTELTPCRADAPSEEKQSSEPLPASSKAAPASSSESLALLLQAVLELVKSQNELTRELANTTAMTRAMIHQTAELITLIEGETDLDGELAPAYLDETPRN